MDDSFKNKLKEIASNSMLGLAICMGHDLKLFDALADVSNEKAPASALVVADKAGLKERYVKEWLCCIACGGLIEVDSSGEHFWIKKENLSELSGPKPNSVFAQLHMAQHFSKISDRLEKVILKDGPDGLPFDHHDQHQGHHGIHQFINAMSHESFEKHFTPYFLTVSGLKERLEGGDLEMLDVGCGTGFQAALAARHFPSSHFIGIDSNGEGLVVANKRKEDQKLTNLEFHQMDAHKLKDDWTGRFDWVLMYTVCHDLEQPDLCLSEVRRVMKDDGILTMIDLNGAGSVAKDIQSNSATSTVHHAVSLFHCLPNAAHAPDALGLMEERGQGDAINRLLDQCGFHNPKVVELVYNPKLALYVCNK